MLKNLFKASLVFALLLVMVSVSGCESKFGQMLANKKLSADEAKVKAETFINTNLMSPGTKATISAITKDYGMYKLMVDIGSGEPIESYMTTDGQIFFPSTLKLKDYEVVATSTTAAPEAITEITKKSDKPVVELFVMSHCPYGTQIEKGMLPVVAALGKKIDFTIKFCDYAMHGDKEIKEELNQYCIQKEQSTKYLAYLTCFLKATDQGPACLKSTGVDTNKMNTCVTKADKAFKVTENFNDTTKKNWKGSYPPFDIFKADNTKYNVGGSPTLIVNGMEASSGRDSASLLKTICSAFNNAPTECQSQLSATTPGAGFGETTGTDSGAACATN